MTLVPGRCLTTRAPTFWQSPGVPRRPNPQSPREQLLNSNRSGDGKMGLAAWALFFPDSADASVVFHGARHAVIVGLVFLALRATPGIFALFLALLSVLEYTRHSRARVLATVHVCVCLAFWLAARPTKSVPGAPPFFLRRLVFRSSVIFAPFVVDKVLVEKVGLAPAITDLLFPLAMGAANEVLSLVDPLGIAVNLGSLCCDYPEVTFVPLRFGGLSLVTMLVAFAAVAASRWRSTRYLRRWIFPAVFKVAPVLMVAVYFGRHATATRGKLVNVGGVVVAPGTTCSRAIAEAEKVVRRGGIVGVSGVLGNCTDGDVERLQKMATEAGAWVFFADSEVVFAVDPARGVKTLASKETKNWLRRCFEAPLLVHSDFGRIQVLTGRQIIREEYYTWHDADLIVSVSGKEFDEVDGIPIRNAMIVSQTTGASLFHVSSVAESFFTESDGHFAFIDEHQDKPIRTFRHTVMVNKNVFLWCSTRMRAVRFATIFAGAVVVMLSLMPRSVVIAVSASFSRKLT